jgi:hypothetical protein
MYIRSLNLLDEAWTASGPANANYYTRLKTRHAVDQKLRTHHCYCYYHPHPRQNASRHPQLNLPLFCQSFTILDIGDGTLEKKIQSQYKKPLLKFHLDEVKLSVNQTLEEADEYFVQLMRT